ncbi:GNAT family N-acetyltransferase [Candidatus Latescibacterota bacterium]
MDELTPEQYDGVCPLFADLVLYPHLPFCVLEGRQPGRVFADDADAPTAALVCHQTGYSYLGGGTEAAAAWLEREMVEALRLERIKLCAAPGFWEERLRAVDHLELRPYAIHTYRLDESRRQGLAALPPVPDVCEVYRITAPMLSHRHNECLVFFGTPEAWERHGVGYALLEEGKVASACVTSFVGNGTCDTSLTTLEPFRRRGYGTQVAAALVQACLDAGIEPIWHTTPDNVASDRIARRLGYDVFATCTMYEVRR